MPLPRPFHRIIALFVLSSLLMTACTRGDTLIPATSTAPSPYSTPTLLPTPAVAREAQLSEAINSVEARESSETAWEAALPPKELFAGNQVQTGEDGQARIDFTEGTIVRLAPNTHLTIQGINQDPDNPVTRLYFDLGKIFVVLGNLLGQEGYLDVETPVGVASVRGSLMSLEWLGDSLLATCFSGDCSAGKLDRVAFTDGEQVRLMGGGLSDPAPAPPEELQDWQDEFGGDLPNLLATEDALRVRSITATAEFFARATQVAQHVKDRDGDGWSRESGDCDDGNPRVFPLAPDDPGDGLDSNCDGVDGLRADQDGDGWPKGRGDCNDLDPRVYPFAPDATGDGVDSNCDGNDGTAPDKDGDGWTLRDGDCDDTNPRVHPKADDKPGDGVDANCDGVDGDAGDLDGDGFESGWDCDDKDPKAFPGALEIPDDKKDNDCDGQVDEKGPTATPTRIFGCLLLRGCATPTPTLDEKKPTGTPTPEKRAPTPTPSPASKGCLTTKCTPTPTPECSPLSISLRCPTSTETKQVAPTKTPTATPTPACSAFLASLRCATPTETKKAGPTKTPTATEPSKATSTPATGGCLSQRCTPTPTKELKPPTSTFTPKPPDPTKTPVPSDTPVPIIDRDGDRYPDYKDCDDGDSSVHPDAPEVEDGKDNDCDGSVDEGFDKDGDGYTRLAGDCDDADKLINPGAREGEKDGIDSNCNREDDE